VKISLSSVASFWHNTAVWQSDRQTDGRLCRSKDALSITCCRA